MPAIHIIIKGKVQGVFYRASASKVAVGLGLTGWVRNTKDGHVEAVACGSIEHLDEFTSWCRKGPSRARVEAVDVTPIEEERFEGFDIVR